MFRTMLKSKIHRATVTDANIDYEGSITIDSQIMEAADIIEHEKVHVLNLENGNRLETYVISGAAASGSICINGAAAKLMSKGDPVIILTYATIADADAATMQSKVVLVDENNKISSINTSGKVFDIC